MVIAVIAVIFKSSLAFMCSYLQRTVRFSLVYKYLSFLCARFAGEDYLDQPYRASLNMQINAHFRRCSMHISHISNELPAMGKLTSLQYAVKICSGDSHQTISIDKTQTIL